MLQRINIFTFLFTIVFLIPTVADLHGFEHLFDDESEESCEVCYELIQHQQSDFDIAGDSYSEGELNSTPCTFLAILKYNISRETIVMPESVYNKPPPIS